MTHPTSSNSGTPDMASLLARVPPEPTPDPAAASKPTTKTAAAAATPATAGLHGKPSVTSTVPAGHASSGGTSPADGTTKGVPVKRLLIWAVPLVFLAVGAVLMNQSPAAGALFLLLALVAVIAVLIGKWLRKRRAARAAANGGAGAKGPIGPGAGRNPGGGRGPGGGRRGLLSKLNPFSKRGAAGGRGPSSSRRASAGGNPAAGGPRSRGGKGGLFGRLNPFSKRGAQGGPAGSNRAPVGGKPPASAAGGKAGKGGLFGKLNPFSTRGVSGTPGLRSTAKTPAGGKTPRSPARATVGSAGLGGKLPNLLPRRPPRTPGGRSPAGGKHPAGGRTPGLPGGPGAAGGGGPLGGLFGGTAGAPSPGGRFGSIRNGLGWLRNRAKAQNNPNHWRNSGSRWQQRVWPFRNGSNGPRTHPSGATHAAFYNPPNPTVGGGPWHTGGAGHYDSAYRGGGQRESFATPNTGSTHQNPDGSFDAEVVDDHDPPRPVIKVHSERADQPAGDPNNPPRPLAPPPTGLGPATTSSTDSSGGNMAHSDQQTGARSANVLENGASTARAGAAHKETVAANHRRQANNISGMQGMDGTAAALRAQAARATVDAGARRGVAAAFSNAASTHRTNNNT